MYPVTGSFSLSFLSKWFQFQSCQQQSLALVNRDSVSIKEVTPDLNQETLLRLCLAQRMWINILVVALTLSQLGVS